MGAGMVSSEAPARAPFAVNYSSRASSPSGRCDVLRPVSRDAVARVAPESSHVSARRRRGGCGSRTGLSVTVPHAPTAYAWERPFSNTGVSGCNQPSSFFTVRGTVRGGALGPSTSPCHGARARSARGFARVPRDRLPAQRPASPRANAGGRGDAPVCRAT